MRFYVWLTEFYFTYSQNSWTNWHIFTMWGDEFWYHQTCHVRIARHRGSPGWQVMNLSRAQQESISAGFATNFQLPQLGQGDGGRDRDWMGLMSEFMYGYICIYIYTVCFDDWYAMVDMIAWEIQDTTESTTDSTIHHPRKGLSTVGLYPLVVVHDEVEHGLKI